MTDLEPVPKGRRQLSEAELIHNPALGAYLLWNMGNSHRAEQGVSPVLHLHFLVLPLLLHRPTLDLVISTQKPSGLALFAAKLGDQQEELLAVQNRMLQLRTLTMQSVALGTGRGLLVIDYSTARCYSREHDVAEPRPPERLKALKRGSDLIGAWFGRLSMAQIATILRVEF